MAVIIEIAVAILRGILPFLFEKAKDTAEEGKVDQRRRAAALKKVRRAGWTPAAIRATAPKLILAALCLFFIVGCQVRTVYVHETAPVRLRETLIGVKVWVLDKDGIPVKGELDLAEGLFVLSLSAEELEAVEKMRGVADP